MPIGQLDHYSIRTLDIEASRRFYTEVMGFEVGFRPVFDFPGVWLYSGAPNSGSYGVVHIIGIDPSNPEGLKAYLGDRDVSTLNGTGLRGSMERIYSPGLAASTGACVAARRASCASRCAM